MLKKSAQHVKFLALCLVRPCRDYLREVSLGTSKILRTGATLHLGPIYLHVENWKCCTALKIISTVPKSWRAVPIF